VHLFIIENKNILQIGAPFFSFKKVITPSSSPRNPSDLELDQAIALIFRLLSKLAFT